MGHAIYDPGQDERPAWNVGRKLGAKRPLLPKQVWAVRFFLEQEHRLRDRAPGNCLWPQASAQLLGERRQEAAFLDLAHVIVAEPTLTSQPRSERG